MDPITFPGQRGVRLIPNRAKTNRMSKSNLNPTANSVKFIHEYDAVKYGTKYKTLCLVGLLIEFQRRLGTRVEQSNAYVFTVHKKASLDTCDSWPIVVPADRKPLNTGG